MDYLPRDYPASLLPPVRPTGPATRRRLTRSRAIPPGRGPVGVPDRRHQSQHPGGLARQEAGRIRQAKRRRAGYRRAVGQPQTAGPDGSVRLRGDRGDRGVRAALVAVGGASGPGRRAAERVGGRGGLDLGPRRTPVRPLAGRTGPLPLRGVVGESGQGGVWGRDRGSGTLAEGVATGVAAGRLPGVVRLPAAKRRLGAGSRRLGGGSVSGVELLLRPSRPAELRAETVAGTADRQRANREGVQANDRA